MWRSFFLAVGISMVILGAECLVFEKAVVAKSMAKSGAASTPIVGRREVIPKEWWPWSLISVGSIVTMWSITMKRD